jgi:hypothetical protein
MYSEIPDNLLNSFGLCIDRDKKAYDLVFLKRISPVTQVVVVNAEIKPDGKISGSSEISSNSYNRINAIARYKTDGEKKYIDYLRDDDNNLKISAIKFENMEVDTLPLTQNITFTLDLSGSDENYIYFNPNLFTPLHKNPFLSESRSSDIDFGYLRNYQVSGNYKIPAGFKVDALPKSIAMTMPDKSVTFKRILAKQDDGTIAVLYIISHKKVIYFKEDYPDFRAFYQKMNEMMNEPIVLKKI